MADLLGQAMNGERGCDASRKKKTVPDGDGFHEPYGFRKYPGGVFSRKAVADLLGQAINGERKVCATSGSR